MQILNRIDPGLKRVIDGYVVNFLSSNYWKVHHIMEWDDAFQEAMFTLLVVEKRLIKSEKDVTLVTPQQYMACFKTCWTRHFITLSNKDTKYQAVVKESEFNSLDDDSNQFNIESLLSDDNVGYIEILIEQAPSEVREVLNLLLHAPKEILDAVASSLKKDVTSNSVLCRLLGHNPNKVDLLKLTENYFNNL